MRLVMVGSDSRDSRTAPETVVAEPYSSQNSSSTAVRIARSTAHCRAGLTCTTKRMSTNHGMPTVVGVWMSTAGCTSRSPVMSPRSSGAARERRVAFSDRATASWMDWEPNSGIGMTTTARAQKFEWLTHTRAVLLGTITVSPLRVRIVVARMVIWMTSP